jgi:hypothetical protein
MEHKMYPCSNTAVELHSSLYVFIVYIVCFVQVQTFLLPFIPHSISLIIVHLHFSYCNQIPYSVCNVTILLMIYISRSNQKITLNHICIYRKNGLKTGLHKFYKYLGATKISRRQMGDVKQVSY